jgi:hypothetical protein
MSMCGRKEKRPDNEKRGELGEHEPANLASHTPPPAPESAVLDHKASTARARLAGYELAGESITPAGNLMPNSVGGGSAAAAPVGRPVCRRVHYLIYKALFASYCEL